MTAQTNWRLPLTNAHQLSASAGKLSFVGGVGDFDGNGQIRRPGDLEGQIEGAVSNMAYALAAESCSLDDVVRIKAHHTSDVDDWDIMAALARHFQSDPMPAISVMAEPMQPFSGQVIQLQVIAQRGWRKSSDIRVAHRPVPPVKADLFKGRLVTGGLRAGEFIVVANRAAESAAGELQHPDKGVEQSHVIMSTHAETLTSLGASFQDCVKLEGYYFGDNLDDWEPLAKARLGYFREPGPVATVVPAHRMNPAGAVTKVEVMAMRELRNGFDKYIPREDHWPDRVWDWPIWAPYRQAIRLRDTIWLGGQVPWNPYGNEGIFVLPGERLPQARFVMGYIEDLLRPFGRTAADLKLMVCYFTSDGSEAEIAAFARTLAECIGGALPPMTLVPKPKMHNDDNTVEIWGVAQG